MNEEKSLVVLEDRKSKSIQCYHLSVRGNWVLRQFDDSQQRLVEVCSGDACSAADTIANAYECLAQFSYEDIHRIFDWFPAARGVSIQNDLRAWFQIANHFLKSYRSGPGETPAKQALNPFATPGTSSKCPDDSISALRHVEPQTRSTQSSEEDERLLALVETAIFELVTEAVQYPLLHFSEKGLHTRLAHKLLCHCEFRDPVPTSVCRRYQRELQAIAIEQGKGIESYHSVCYRVPPLQTEYGNNLPGPFRIDLVVLHPHDIQRIVDTNMREAAGQYLQPFVGIEFGTEKTGPLKLSEHVERDRMKLAQCAHAYGINVIRNTNFRRASGQSAKKKSEQLQAFRDILTRVAQHDDGINWIAVVLHIAFGTAELFVDGAWQTIEVTRDMNRFEASLSSLLPRATVG